MKEFLTVLLNQICFYPLALTAATLFAALAPTKRPSMLLWMLCALPVSALYYARKHCRHLPVLLLAHIGVLLFIYLLPAENDVNRSIRVLVGIGFVIYSLSLRFRTEDFASGVVPLPLAAGLSFVGLYLQHYQGNWEWDLYYRMSVILVFLLYAVILFWQSYEDFLAVNKLSTGKIPFQEIFCSGMYSTTLFVVISGIVLFIISQFAWLKPFLLALRSALVTFLRFLFRLIPEDSGTLEITPEQHAGNGNMPLPEAGEPFLLWVILEYLAMIALLAGAVFLLYRFLRKLLLYLREKWQVSFVQNASEKADLSDKREKLTGMGEKPVGRKNKDRVSFFFPDAARKIRYLYQRKIGNSGLDKSRLLYYTALDAQTALDLDGMAAIYEKARYSEEVCTEEDVRKMKAALKKS